MAEDCLVWGVHCHWLGPAAGAMVTQCPSLTDAPSLPPQETLFFSATYHEMARRGIPGGGREQDNHGASFQMGMREVMRVPVGGGVFLWAPLHVPATRAPTGPCQGDNKEDKARFPV